MKGPDQLARTIAVRESRPDQLPLGSRAGARPRRGARGHSREREQAGEARADPGAISTRLCAALAAAGIESLWAHQADTLEAARLSGHAIVTRAPRQRQVARVQPSGPRHPGERPALAPSTSTRRRRSRRTRPATSRALRPGGPARGDLRRRHAARGAAAIRRRSNLDPHEPGHAPRRRSAEPPPRGETCSPTSRWVVVDEAHVYRGVFGSHVANAGTSAVPGVHRHR